MKANGDRRWRHGRFDNYAKKFVERNWNNKGSKR